MTLLNKVMIQRVVGALVLVALAVIFLPMLFNREDAGSETTVDVPAMPATPAMPQTEMQPVAVPEPAPQPIPQDFEIIEDEVVVEADQPAAPISAVPPASAPTDRAAPVEPEQRLDAANLPVSWSVQLASLSNRENAEALQKTLRSQGYNAYVRSAGGLNRVFVGPVIERAEADRLRAQLGRQYKLDGFLVRFEPEES